MSTLNHTYPLLQPSPFVREGQASPRLPHPQLQAIKRAVNCAWVWWGCRGAGFWFAAVIARPSRLLTGINSPKPWLCTRHTPQACNRRQELRCSLSWEPAALE